jgi:hypothetical protein
MRRIVDDRHVGSNHKSGGQNGAAQEGLQCLIHTTTTGLPGSNPEQDTLNTSFANNGLLADSTVS